MNSFSFLGIFIIIIANNTRSAFTRLTLFFPEFVVKLRLSLLLSTSILHLTKFADCFHFSSNVYHTSGLRLQFTSHRFYFVREIWTIFENNFYSISRVQSVYFQFAHWSSWNETSSPHRISHQTHAFKFSQQLTFPKQ